MPEYGPRPPRRKRRHVLVSACAIAITGCIALCLLAYPSYRDWYARKLGPQTEVRVQSVQDSALRHWVASTDQRLVPVVLNYHDVTDGQNESEYAFTADHFERHMQALHRAGFQSLRAAEYLAYLRGEFVPPPKSFYLTFDDGTQGLYRNADPILQRYGFTATAFCITGMMNARQPYYLTWEQAVRMRDSGRWEFGFHAHAEHSKITSKFAAPSSLLVARRAVSDTPKTFESVESVVRRAQESFDTSTASFAERRIDPVPILAWPFSHTARSAADARPGSAVDQEAATAVLELASARFQATLTNASRPRAVTARNPVSGRYDRSGPVERIELRDTDTEDQLLSYIGDYQPGRPALTPITERAGWEADWMRAGRVLQFKAGGRAVTVQPDHAQLTVRADYQPEVVGSWEAVRGRASLPVPTETGTSVGFGIGLGGPDEVFARATSDTVFLMSRKRGDPEPRVVWSRKVAEVTPAQPSRIEVSLTVRRGEVVVDIVGQHTETIARHGFDHRLGLVFERESARNQWLTAYDVQVERLPE